jgi:hypothetical protein
MTGKNPLPNCKTPLGYSGINISSPELGWSFVRNSRDPTSHNTRNPSGQPFQLGSQWMNTTNGTLWILSANPGIWVQFGTVSPVGSITGANGVDASPSTGAVTVSGINATTSTAGVASFDSSQFTVTSGAVSLISHGQTFQDNVTFANRITLVNLTITNLGSITLPAGKWSVSGMFGFELSGTDLNDEVRWIQAGISTTSATFNIEGVDSATYSYFSASAGTDYFKPIYISITPFIINTSGTNVYYCVEYQRASVNDVVKSFGSIQAIRIA